MRGFRIWSEGSLRSLLIRTLRKGLQTQWDFKDDDTTFSEATELGTEKMLKYLRNLLKLRRHAEKKRGTKQRKHELIKADAALIDALMFPTSVNDTKIRNKKLSAMPNIPSATSNRSQLTSVTENTNTPVNTSNKKCECCHRWTSFESLVADKYGMNAFKRFLRSEFSEENIAFWEACEHFKQIKSKSKLRRKASKLFQEYIEEGSSKQVNIDSGTRTAIKGSLSNPTPDMFNQVQQRLQHLMENDSFRRFQMSDIYKLSHALKHRCNGQS